MSSPLSAFFNHGLLYWNSTSHGAPLMWLELLSGVEKTHFLAPGAPISPVLPFLYSSEVNWNLTPHSFLVTSQEYPVDRFSLAFTVTSVLLSTVSDPLFSWKPSKLTET